MKRLILSFLILGISAIYSIASTDISIRIPIEKKEYGNISITMQRTEDVSYNELSLKTVYYKDIISAEYFINSDYSKQWIFVNILDVTEGLKARLSVQWTDWIDRKLMVGLGYKYKFKSLNIDCSYDTNLDKTYSIKNKIGVILNPTQPIKFTPSWTYIECNNEEPKGLLFLEIKVTL